MPHHPSTRIGPLALLLLLPFAGPLPAEPPDRELPDYTKVDLDKLGIKPVRPKEDPRTGFIVGGKNPTLRITRLTEIAGRSIDDLEADMRPGTFSSAGFLGKDERLLDVLAMDNRTVVDQLGLPHQELARHLQVLGALAVQLAAQQPKEIRYHGRRYRLRARLFRGFVQSPFQDRTRTNAEATVENLDNGKKVSYSLLVPQMIERYGFYEGKGTRFRVDPRTILDALDFIKAKPASRK